MDLRHISIVLVYTGLCFPACGGGGDSGLISSAYASMARVAGEATVDECPNGGVLFEAGIDIDG